MTEIFDDPALEVAPQYRDAFRKRLAELLALQKAAEDAEREVRQQCACYYPGECRKCLELIREAGLKALRAEANRPRATAPADLPPVALMTVAEAQAELRAIMATPHRFPGDADRRRHLWRKIDEARRRGDLE